ncbi:MAG: glycosyltransferase [Chloroflexales bacterium]|nr:glycosyltransferase [Chloroflexales bacterium]
MNSVAAASAHGRCPPALADLPPPPAGRVGWPWTEGSPPLPERLSGDVPWPLISIVTPSYNQASYLEETIRSVLLQGYPNLEYIVMDGGSTDGSVEILQRYAPWLSYWQSCKDGGQSMAIAEGFDRAQGSILAWINSDDRYQPGALARVAQFFSANPRVIFGNGDVHIIDAESRISSRLNAVRPVPTITANLGAHCWAQQGSFWQSDAYRRIGGLDRSLRFCMDRDLFLRLTRSGPARRIPGPPLGDFRLHEEAKTARWDAVFREEDRLLRTRHGSRLRHYPAYQIWLYCLWEIEMLKRGLRRRAIRLGFEV